MSHRRDFPVGARVELHPATDDWMRGDRYGEIVGYGRKRQYRDRETGELTMHHPILVKLDKSGKRKRFHQEALTVIEEKKKNPPGWGPGEDYQSTGPITTVAQLHRLARDLLKCVHADSIMAAAANLALRQPDFFLARPVKQEELIDMVKRYCLAPPRKLSSHPDADRFAADVAARKRKKNAPLKDVRAVGANMTEAHHGLIHILYSYKTPVAIFGPSGLYKTEKHWSNTTAKHIGKWFRSWDMDPKGAAKLPQETIEVYAEMGKDPGTAPEFARSKNPKRTLSVPEQHQLKIARDTLKMNDAMVRVMGGPSKTEARAIIARLTGKRANPYSAKAKFRHVRVRTPKRFVTKSLRTLSTNGKRVIVGHLKGEKRRTKSGRTRLTVQAILRPKGRSARMRGRRNPLIGVLGNPPKGTYLGKATYIEYTHAHDGKKYYHDFRPAVFAVLTDKHTLVLYHPTNELFKLFEVP
jgi:hypothetical protein